MILKSGDKFKTIGDDHYFIEIIGFNNRKVKLKDSLGDFKIDCDYFKDKLQAGYFIKWEMINNE